MAMIERIKRGILVLASGLVVLVISTGSVGAANVGSREILNHGYIPATVLGEDIKIVNIMFTSTCSVCGNDKAEGDYSIATDNGSIYCKECGEWTELKDLNSKVLGMYR